MYRIENLDLFMFIKDLGWPRILNIEGHQWCAILPRGFKQSKNSEDDEGSCYAAIVSPSPEKSMDDHAISIMGKIFAYPFVHILQFMIEMKELD